MEEGLDATVQNNYIAQLKIRSRIVSDDGFLIVGQLTNCGIFSSVIVGKFKSTSGSSTTGLMAGTSIRSEILR